VTLYSEPGFSLVTRCERVADPGPWPRWCKIWNFNK